MASLIDVPTFENGWICRECWSANREYDSRCYRCHAVPKIREMPQVADTPAAAKPPEERRKVTRLTASPPPAAEPAPPAPAVPAAATPAPERQPVRLTRVWAWSAAMVAWVSRFWRLVRAVPRAPGTARANVAARIHAGTGRATSSLAGVLAHRRTWLAVAWLISALSCALLLSAALGAPLAASLLLVAGVGIFSALTTAITASALDRPRDDPGRNRALVPPAEHPTAEVLGGRAAH